MSFHITYRRLFEVHILHDYFLYIKNKSSDKLRPFDILDTSERKEVLSNYDIRKVLQVEPTVKTAKRMKSQKLIFKTTPLGFFVAVRFNEKDKKPFIPINDFSKFTFKVKLLDPFFMNFSNLRLRRQEHLHRPYYFSNLWENMWHGHLFLNKPVYVYAADDEYYIGDLVRHPDNSGQLFEACTDTPGNIDSDDWVRILEVPDQPPVESPPSEKWEPVLYQTYQEYANFQDKIPTRPATFGIDVKHLALDKLSIQLIRYMTDGQQGEVVYDREEKSEDANKNLEHIVTRFQEVESGPYVLRILNETGEEITTDVSGLFYLDTQLYRENIFGIIEIHHRAGLISHRLIEESGELRKEQGELSPPLFLLRFKNRSTQWRFILNTDKWELSQLKAEGNKAYLEEALKPLTANYYFFQTKYKLKNPNGTNKSHDINLPNPKVDLLKAIRKNNDRFGPIEKLISETHIDL